MDVQGSATLGEYQLLGVNGKSDGSPEKESPGSCQYHVLARYLPPLGGRPCRIQHVSTFDFGRKLLREIVVRVLSF